MRIQASDHLLIRCATLAKPLLLWLGDLESAWLQRDLRAISIDKPVFISGLARSGTTILLEILAGIGGIATHRYRDFPFLMVPYLWNRYLDVFEVRDEPVERAQRDRIQITRESPEAFEEPIWQAFFPHLHDRRAIHRLACDGRHERFESFYRDHIKKILLIREGRRYLSKANYNLSRIEYLAAVFPDARFIVPIRHPFSHVYSLVRQHRLFTDYASEDSRVPKYLSAAGHYEFGPQRVPIRFSHGEGDRIESAWDRGDDFAGYAIQWAEVYRFVDSLIRRQDEISKRLLVVRYEDFCADPKGTLDRVLQHADITSEAASAFESLDRVSQSTLAGGNLGRDVREMVWNETEAVAGAFGYRSMEDCTRDGEP